VEQLLADVSFIADVRPVALGQGGHRPSWYRPGEMTAHPVRWIEIELPLAQDRWPDLALPRDEPRLGRQDQGGRVPGRFAARCWDDESVGAASSKAPVGPDIGVDPSRSANGAEVESIVARDT
jgi:hypothetical protein